jgi:hypothetical protein
MKAFCPYRQASLIQSALAPDKMHVAFLIGAGCPVSIRTVLPNGSSAPLMPDIAGLTKKVQDALIGDSEYQKTFDAVLVRTAGGMSIPPTVEQILSCVRALHDIAGPTGIDGLSKDRLAALDKKICQLTTTVVQERLPDENTPYHQLASWVGGIRRKYPVELFTPNYDLLMEQALEERRVPYFDGFVGGDRTFFDLTAIEQDLLPARWARLWKLHGSINWWRTAKAEVQRRASAVGSDDRQMIYPSHLKYDESRRMPYLAMLDRLKAFLNHGQSVLVTCGYSFGDQHLNEVILQGLNGNPTAICFGLLYGEKASSPEAIARASRQANLSILAVDGAVLGTIEGEWESIEKREHALYGVAVRSGLMPERTDCPEDRSKFLLGDFASFGRFIAQQLSENDLTEEKSDGK